MPSVAVLVGALIVGAPGVFAIAGPIFFGIIIIRAGTRWLTKDDDEADRDQLQRWGLISFVAHLLVGWITYLIPVIYVTSDAKLYDRIAVQIANHWQHGFPVESVAAGSWQSLPSGKEGFFYMLAALYRVFGHNELVGIIVNAMIGTLLMPIVYDTTKRLFGRNAARWAALLTALPAFHLWTSAVLREAGVLFLMAVVMNVAVRLSTKTTPTRLALMTVALALLFTFRGNVAFLYTITLLVALVLSRRRLATGIGTGATVATVAFGLIVGAGIGYSGYQVSVQANLDQVNASRSELSSTAGSGFHENADVSTPTGAISYLPIGFTNFFLGPFPWQLTSARQAFALPDVFLWWMLLPSLVRGILAGWKRVGRRVFLMILPAGIICAMLSLLIGNFGTVVRERLQIVVLLLPFIGLGLALRRRTDEVPARPGLALGVVGGG
jgi:4-amino-4-deoxy-L-arabinose transferase-like glycosyltransferase